MEVIKKRRTLRKFNGLPVKVEVINKLLEAAMQAPSANNEQPWEFVVIREKDTLERLAQMSPYAGCVAGASAAIVFLTSINRMQKLSRWYIQDMSAAVENLLIEATYLKLGAVWLGVDPDNERKNYISNLLQTPPYIIPFCVVAIGYPRSEGENHYINRYDSSRIHYEMY